MEQAVLAAQSAAQAATSEVAALKAQLAETQAQLGTLASAGPSLAPPGGAGVGSGARLKSIVDTSIFQKIGIFDGEARIGGVGASSSRARRAWSGLTKFWQR